MTDPRLLSELARVNKLQRVSGPETYRLMAVEKSDGRWIGQTGGGLTLREDIACYRWGDCRPLYAVFVRPRTPAAAMGLPAPVSLPKDERA